MDSSLDRSREFDLRERFVIHAGRSLCSQVERHYLPFVGQTGCFSRVDLLIHQESGW